MPFLSDPADCRYGARETTTGKPDEPEQLGLLVDIDVLKKGASRGKRQHDMFVSCSSMDADL